MDFDNKKQLLELSRQEWAETIAEAALPAFRLGQMRRWIFARKTDTLDRMTDISKNDRAALANLFKTQILENGENSLLAGKEIQHIGSDDATEKLLIEWPDGHRVESVLLRDDTGHRTACVSTQVGCAMGCAFCASGMDGFVRNLTGGEILEQLVRLNALLPNGERLTHIVVMGTGEPTLNFDALHAALSEATASDGLDIGNRRVTVSTVGLPDGIRRMAAAGVPYKLAVSLHAPDNETRNLIIPQNRHVGIQNVLAAADDFFRASGRRVTFEYILIAGINDSTEQARKLARILDRKTAVVNLIPYNPIPELPYKTPSAGAVARFRRTLEELGIAVKVRFRKGDRIDAACGQLRRSCRGDTSKKSDTP